MIAAIIEMGEDGIFGAEVVEEIIKSGLWSAEQIEESVVDMAGADGADFELVGQSEIRIEEEGSGLAAVV